MLISNWDAHWLWLASWKPRTRSLFWFGTIRRLLILTVSKGHRFRSSLSAIADAEPHTKDAVIYRVAYESLAVELANESLENLWDQMLWTFNDLMDFLWLFCSNVSCDSHGPQVSGVRHCALRCQSSVGWCATTELACAKHLKRTCEHTWTLYSGYRWRGHHSIHRLKEFPIIVMAARSDEIGRRNK